MSCCIVLQCVAVSRLRWNHRTDGGGIEEAQNSELEEKHQLVRRMNDLLQELGGSEFIINPLTAPYCSASDLRTAVAAWEALATSERAKSST